MADMCIDTDTFDIRYFLCDRLEVSMDVGWLRISWKSSR